MFRNAQLLTGIFPSMFLTPSCWEHFPTWGFLNDQRPDIKILPTWHWNGYIWPTTPNGKSRSYPAQQQRVFIARALAQQADLLLLDEPLVGIDALSEANIIQILTELCHEGKTVVMVHHDLSNI